MLKVQVNCPGYVFEISLFCNCKFLELNNAIPDARSKDVSTEQVIDKIMKLVQGIFIVLLQLFKGILF